VILIGILAILMFINPEKPHGGFSFDFFELLFCDGFSILREKHLFDGFCSKPVHILVLLAVLLAFETR